jgi:hypothetical protein
MFGTKLDPPGAGSMGGGSLGPAIRASTMNLEGELFARSDGVTSSTPLGTLTCQRLGPGATEAVAAHAAARSAALAAERRSPRSRSSLVRSRSQYLMPLDPILEARLERLGIGTGKPNVGRQWFTVVDLPLT